MLEGEVLSESRICLMIKERELALVFNKHPLLGPEKPEFERFSSTDFANWVGRMNDVPAFSVHRSRANQCACAFRTAPGLTEIFSRKLRLPRQTKKREYGWRDVDERNGLRDSQAFRNGPGMVEKKRDSHRGLVGQSSMLIVIAVFAQALSVIRGEYDEGFFGSKLLAETGKKLPDGEVRIPDFRVIQPFDIGLMSMRKTES